MFNAYEETIRVPLVISHPLRDGVTDRRDLRNADLHDLLLNGLA